MRLQTLTGSSSAVHFGTDTDGLLGALDECRVVVLSVWTDWEEGEQAARAAAQGVASRFATDEVERQVVQQGDARRRTTRNACEEASRDALQCSFKR